MSEKELFWNGVGTLGEDIKKGDKLPDGFKDPRLDGWLKDGTVTSSKPDMSEQLKDEAELLRMELAEANEKNAALKGISSKLVEAEKQIEALEKKNKKLEDSISKLQNKVNSAVSEVIKKLKDDSMSRKEKDESSEILKGLTQ